MLLTKPQRHQLLRLAQTSIVQGLHSGAPLVLTLANYEAALCQPRASFVTLERFQRLRGCIGHLYARQPLVQDVVENAFAAAFRDPRFSPLMASELAGLTWHIAVLSPPEALAFASEAELLAQLRPAIDGLIVQADGHQATYLPSVWAQLPQPHAFWQQLKHKAGLAADCPVSALRVWRYTTESFGSATKD